jgi:death-on-curing protein
MESLGNNNGFLDGNKRIAFTATDVFLRRNDFYLDVDALEAREFIDGSMERQEFRFPQILDWIRQHITPLR